MTSARVSVVMPIRDGERWLAQAIESVLSQTFGDFELLVIDDGSRDETPGIIAGLAKRDARIRHVSQDSLGLVAALNSGLALASGEFIARLDADDVARPMRLATQVAAMDADQNLVLLGSWADTIDPDGRVTGRLTPEHDENKLRAVLARTNPFVHSSIMMRTDVARRCGGYRAAFEAAEDYDLWLRLSEQGGIAIMPQTLVAYRQHGTNVSARKAARQLFSTRFAAHTAIRRRQTGDDPADSLTMPPDWRQAVADDTLADDLNILRLLELADPDVAATADLSVAAIDAALQSNLNHRERKQAQASLLNLLARQDRPASLSALKLISEMIRLHPPRAIKWLAHRFASR